ncbi:MAG TPA: hypothetical protein VGI43_18320 [Mucilaginibacter sp.]
MKKILLCFIVSVSFLLISKHSNAQGYTTAIGLKFGGFENGISVKYFTDSDVSLEGVVGFRTDGVVITGLYEFNQQAFGVNELKFYYGAGAHIGAIGSGIYHRYNGLEDDYTSGHLLLGIDGVIGLEYSIPDLPLAISLDLNPRLELATGPFVDLAPGLGLKYTF